MHCPAHPQVKHLAQRAEALLQVSPDLIQKITLASGLLTYFVYLDHPVKARRLIDQIDAQIEQQPIPPFARLRWCLSVSMFLQGTGEFGLLLTKLEQCLALARESGVLVLNTLLRIMVLQAHIALGDSQQAEALRKTIEGTPQLSYFERSHFLYVMIFWELQKPNAPLLVERTETLMTMVNDTGLPVSRILSHALLVQCYGQQGRLPEATAQLAAARELSQCIGSRYPEYLMRIKNIK